MFFNDSPVNLLFGLYTLFLTHAFPPSDQLDMDSDKSILLVGWDEGKPCEYYSPAAVVLMQDFKEEKS